MRHSLMALVSIGKRDHCHSWDYNVSPPPTFCNDSSLLTILWRAICFSTFDECTWKASSETCYAHLSTHWSTMGLCLYINEDLQHNLLRITFNPNLPSSAVEIIHKLFHIIKSQVTVVLYTMLVLSLFRRWFNTNTTVTMAERQRKYDNQEV